MADITFNGTIVVETKVDPDNAGIKNTLPVKQANGRYVDTNVDAVIVTDVVIAEGNEIVEIATIA